LYDANDFLHEANERFGTLIAVRHVQMLGYFIVSHYVIVKDGKRNKNLSSPCRLKKHSSSCRTTEFKEVGNERPN